MTACLTLGFPAVWLRHNCPCPECRDPVTGQRLVVITDNPYRDPVPTVQLLHCLREAAAGGDTGLIDGFAAAAALRAEDRKSSMC
jgi:alpha-ketoglutarate-dependent taurine dioxygenase